MYLYIASVPPQTFIGYEKSSYTFGSLGIASCVDLRDIRTAASVVRTVGRWRKALHCGRNMVRA